MGSGLLGIHTCSLVWLEVGIPKDSFINLDQDLLKVVKKFGHVESTVQVWDLKVRFNNRVLLHYHVRDYEKKPLKRASSQGQLYYSGQKWRFWGRASWVHFFTRSLWPNQWHNFKKIGAKWKIWVFSFHRYPMSLCRSHGLDTTTQQSWATFWKIQLFHKR